jgi:enamine deaminase RidA (YjgF/YER057c/UK114 family)
MTTMKRTYSWPAGHWGWLIPVSHKHGIRAGRMVYVGGQVDKDIKGLVLHHYDLKTQTRVVVKHIQTVLRDLDIALDDIVKLVVFYVNDGSVDEDAFLADLRTLLGAGPAPALTTVPISYLAYPGMLLEIDTIAMRREDQTALPRTVSAPSGHWRLAGSFSQGLRCGEMIFVSGQVARGPSGEVRHPGDLARQSTDVMEHVGRILSEHGATFDDVVKINSYYVDGGHGDAWRRSIDACRAFFRSPGPVVTGIPLRWLPDGLVVKTEVIAMLGEDGRPLARRSLSGEGYVSALVPAPFSPALQCGPMIFVSGQVSTDARGTVLDPGALVPQTHTVMGKVRTLLAEFGLSMNEVVKVNAFFKSGGTAEELNDNLRVRSACFTEPGPATTGISLPALTDHGMMIDVEVTAMPR